LFKKVRKDEKKSGHFYESPSLGYEVAVLGDEWLPLDRMKGAK